MRHDYTNVSIHIDFKSRLQLGGNNFDDPTYQYKIIFRLAPKTDLPRYKVGVIESQGCSASVNFSANVKKMASLLYINT